MIHVELQISKLFSNIAIFSFVSHKSIFSPDSIIVHLAGETKSEFERAGNSLLPMVPIINDTYRGSSSSL